MGIYIGIDIGGTKMMVAAVGSDFGAGQRQVLRRCKELTPLSLQAGLDQLFAMVDAMAVQLTIDN